MKADFSQALMALAASCLGKSRREWARAMQAEFEIAKEDHRALAFAAGCLIAAWRAMPQHAEGRLVLTNYALALGFLLPIAYLQFACAIGLATGQGGIYAMLSGGGSHDGLLLSQLRAIPALLGLWLLLGVAHLRLAWVVLEGDWQRVVKAGALIASAMLTLLTFMIMLLLDPTFLFLQGFALAFELIAILALARWHGRVFTAPSDMPPAL